MNWLKQLVMAIISPLVTQLKRAGWIHPNADQAPGVPGVPKDQVPTVPKSKRT